ncbi:hypothetical protein E2562_017306 [Oryza meyeriana var. granulata]|uniref:Uncharacterized protein n=1 Tax=Oryza meyeriana var. granulata TaxID=110450 RepID=A0A6G1EMA0_9ORYZ|nr:hypothetical protein E2562_017306 [Oryza meyeriana var. granulata]
MAKVMNQEFTKPVSQGQSDLALLSNLEAAFGAMKLEYAIEASTSTNKGGYEVHRRKKGKKKRSMNMPYGQ